jgi:hypothetical protein
MSDSTIPARLPEPPPADVQLSAEGRVLGWAHADRFGFHGFADEIEAARAASVAYRAIAQRLAREASPPFVPVAGHQLHLQRDGERVRILADGQRIATLIPPGHDASAAAASFGFEIESPPPTDELRARSLAHRAYIALRRAGVRWAMFDEEVEGAAHSAPASPRSDAGRDGVRPVSAVSAVVAVASVMLIALALVSPHAVAILLSAIGITSLLALRVWGGWRGWLPTPGVPIRRRVPPRMPATAHAAPRSRIRDRGHS